jgi:acetylornithine deacetylase/succinyl-diaminopimelate desuccinylase-like protein
MQKRFLDAASRRSEVHLLGRPAQAESGGRIKGTGDAKPVLFLCHMDVVEALPKDWHTDPFKFIEQDGYYYGRGTQDMKDSDAALVETFLALHREGYKPRRDLILALTADEEGGRLQWRQLAGAESSRSGGCGVCNQPGCRRYRPGTRQTGRGRCRGFRESLLRLSRNGVNRGGHSSLPRPDNAIYELTAALNKLAAYRFPFELNDVTRAYCNGDGEARDRLRKLQTCVPSCDSAGHRAIDRLSTDPGWNSILHTTCVATRLAAGHANNALPQSAEANINCRILPVTRPRK